MLDKNDGVFLPSIQGIISGKTTQVDGMNGILNNIQGNCNYLYNKISNSNTGLDNKVNRNGDTVTGIMNFNSNIFVNNSRIKLQNLTQQSFLEYDCLKDAYIMFGNADDTVLYIQNRTSASTTDIAQITKSDFRVLNTLYSNNKLVCHEGNFNNTKEFCPYRVGQIMFTTFGGHPASWYPGTTWERVSGRFILGAEDDSQIWQTGGSWSKNITQYNLPPHIHEVNDHSHYNLPHAHTFEMKSNADENGDNPLAGYPGNAQVDGIVYTSRQTSVSAENTAGMTAATFTSSVGAGEPLDVTNPFIKFAIWIRKS